MENQQLTPTFAHDLDSLFQFDLSREQLLELFDHITQIQFHLNAIQEILPSDSSRKSAVSGSDLIRLWS